MRISGCLLALLLTARTGFTAELQYLSVDRYDDLYLLDFIVLINLPEKDVRKILLNPQRYAGINPSIQELQEITSPDADKRRFKSRVSECVWFFCVDYTNVNDIEVGDNGDIIVRLVPELSDFEVSHSIWRTKSVSEKQTRLSYFGESEPSFWVPPLIGTSIIRSRLEEIAVVTAKRMECEYHRDPQCEKIEKQEKSSDIETIQ